MLLLTTENQHIKIETETYRLEFPSDRPFVYLDTPLGHRAADLFILSGVQPMTGRDDTTSVGLWQTEVGPGEVLVWLEAKSTVWERKIYRFRCESQRFSYEVEVFGRGELDEVDYFGGYASCNVRWGSGFFYSGQRFYKAFNPEPTVDEMYTFAPEVSSSINLTGVPLPGKAGWFFTPPPFQYSFEINMPGDLPADSWMGVGLEALPGHNTYTELRYQGLPSAFHLELAYEGHTCVDGHLLLPAIGFDFGPDPYTLLAEHIRRLRADGLVPTVNAAHTPAWWPEPIFCGWGAQCYQAGVHGGRASDQASQVNYEGFLANLARHQVLPGTIVLDDKWQNAYGTNTVDEAKWPNLPGFIRDCHARGQHVLLWLKAWDAEGVPAGECIRNAAGLPLAVDPSNPAFAARLRASVRTMLSAGGYDADGFKIDFSARIPSGPGIRTWNQAIWGLELMRLYLAIIHEEAQLVKPDALIITHTPHPYLADLIGAVRLNDINTQHDVVRQMEHRARVASIACPEALIDMDNWPMRDKANWRAYLSHRPLRGIPALYFASHIDASREALDQSDFALLRQTWEEYRTQVMVEREHWLTSSSRRFKPNELASSGGTEIISE